MTDAVAVFPPGYRLTDSTDGSPLSGAVIRFYDAGTTTPKIVYADQDLTSPLGTSVTTNALGAPTTNGTTQTLIYVGTASYDVYCETSTGAQVHPFPFLNVKGAVVSDDGTNNAAVTALFPVVTKSLDYNVLSTDQNKLIAVNCSGGDVVLTLPSAVDVGNGWGFPVQHAGSANQAVLATVSSQTISEGSKSFGTKFALGLNGEEAWIISDGGNWRVTNHTTPFPKVMPIPVIDRITSAPGGPVEGGYYLVTAAYSTFSTHDIIQYTGGGYVAFTPYTDCGWIAWVADEDLYYHFRGTAWVSEYATASIPGALKISSQSVQETGTATDTAVTPATQQFHAGHPKAWGYVTVSGGTPTLATSYNMTSITDTALGRLGTTIATDFSGVNYCAQLTITPASIASGGSNKRYPNIAPSTKTSGTIEFNCTDQGGTPDLNDPAAYDFMMLGDQ